MFDPEIHFDLLETLILYQWIVCEAIGNMQMSPKWCIRPLQNEINKAVCTIKTYYLAQIIDKGEKDLFNASRTTRVLRSLGPSKYY